MYFSLTEYLYLSWYVPSAQRSCFKCLARLYVYYRMIFSIKRRHQLAQQAQVYHVHYRELGELLKQKEMGKLYLLDMLSG